MNDEELVGQRRQLLSNIVEISAGQSAPQGEANYCDDGIPFVKAGNLQYLTSGGSLNNIQKVSEEVAKAHQLKLYQKGTILFAKSGMSCLKGYVYVLPQNAYVVSHLACITPKHDLSNYLRYYFVFYKPNKLIKDDAYPSISLADIGNLEIDVKDESTRKYIISVLSSVEDIIRLKKQELQLLDDLAKSQFVEMFGDSGNTPYEVSSIGVECRLKSGTTFASDKELPIGDYPYIKVSDMNLPGNEVVITTSSAYVAAKTAGTSFIEKGAVIFPKRGGAIGTNKKRILLRDTCADLNIMGVIPGKRLTTEYLYVYFLLMDLAKICDGSTIPQLNNKNIAPLHVIVPPIAVQKRFVAFVQQLDKSKFAIRKSLDEMQLLYDSLMQQYFG